MKTISLAVETITLGVAFKPLLVGWLVGAVLFVDGGGNELYAVLGVGSNTRTTEIGAGTVRDVIIYCSFDATINLISPFLVVRIPVNMDTIISFGGGGTGQALFVFEVS